MAVGMDEVSAVALRGRSTVTGARRKLGERLKELREDHGYTQRRLAERITYSRTALAGAETGRDFPSLTFWKACDAALAADGELVRSYKDIKAHDGVLKCDGAPELAPRVDDEIEALELARRAAASDVGDATLTQLELAVDDLAIGYATGDAATLLDHTRRHLRYVGQLLDARKTLTEHRRLLVVGGWLSLLAGTLHVDLLQQGPAVARLRAAESLAREGGHDEIRAWCLETEAWRVLTLGAYERAATLSQGAQQLAPKGSSALIQATAQEGRAWARIGDGRSTQAAVDRVNRMASPLVTPDRPEHHYRYDPAKATSYTATTLSWIGDPAAVDAAREVITTLSAENAHGGRPRRLAVARLDLALALIAEGSFDEAAVSALDAVLSGWVAPSNHWRALEVVQATEAAGTRDATPLREAYRELARSP